MCMTNPFFYLKDSGLRDEEGKKININDTLKENQKRSSHFLSFVMTVRSEQADTKYKHINMTCRACVQLPIDVGKIYARIYTQMMKNSHILLFHLADFYNGRNAYIGKINKEKGGILS